MTKTHFIKRTGVERTACRRYIGSKMRTTQDAFRVSCKDCQKTTAWFAALAAAQSAKKAAFEGQEPRVIGEPWREGIILCSGAVQGPLGGIPIVPCGNDKFRVADRTCMGHYANYVCSECGHTESRLTETGRSF